MDCGVGPSLPSYKGNNTLESFLLRGLIAKGTCSSDESKRAALVATDPFLCWNGFYLEIEPQAPDDVMVTASQPEVFKKELIFEWILEVCEKMEDFEEVAGDCGRPGPSPPPSPPLLAGQEKA